MVFSADTLFKGGPGATGRSFSSFPTIIESIRTSCSRCRPTPSCTPATATTPGSATRRPTSRSGSPGVTEPVRTTTFAKVFCKGSVQSMTTPDRELRILHPTGAQLQTLAHPLRSRLLGALRFHGPATSTALAARLGTNSGATSYHLRQLAEAGLVEDDPERSNGRDRWWRAAHDATSWRSTDFDDDPDARAADDWLVRRQAHVAAGWLNDWLEGRNEWSAEWRDAADQSDYHLDLTAEGLRALMDDLRAVAERYRDAPAGTRRRARDAPAAGVPEPGARGVSAADLRSIRRRFYLLLSLRFVPTGLFVTVFVLLMLERGLSLAQIGLGTAAQGVVMLFLELPSGGLADALGRKPVLILATLFSIAAMSLLLVADTVLAPGHRVGAPGRVPSARQRSARGVVHRRLDRRRSRRRHRARAVAAERRDLHVDRPRRHARRAHRLDRRACSRSTPSSSPSPWVWCCRSSGWSRSSRSCTRSAPAAGWAAARQSIATVPDVVRGAVRLIHGQLAAHRARRRRAPVGLRHDRVRGVPAAAAGPGERRRGGGDSAARPGDHRGVGAVGGGGRVRPVAGAALRVRGRRLHPAVRAGRHRGGDGPRRRARPASSSPTSPTTGPTARRRPCTTGWSTAPSRRAIAPRSCRPTRSRPRWVAPSAASSSAPSPTPPASPPPCSSPVSSSPPPAPSYLVGRSAPPRPSLDAPRQPPSTAGQARRGTSPRSCGPPVRASASTRVRAALGCEAVAFAPELAGGGELVGWGAC